MADKNTRVTVRGRFVGGGLFEAREDPRNPDRKAKFSACIVLDDGEDKKVSEAVENALENKWGNKLPGGLQDWGVREGDDPDYEASFEKMFINPKSTKKPAVLRRDGTTHVQVEQKDDVVYPGCYVAVSIDAYAYDGDKKGGIKPGVTLTMRSVLYRKKGERLDDYVNPDKEFEGIEVEEIEVEGDDDFLGTD